MYRKIAAVLCSVLLLSPGWLSLTGWTLPFAFVPLLWLSAQCPDSRRGWWEMFGWALLTFVGWNVATVWWIWNATPVGPVAATIVSSSLNMFAFMIFHTLSKKSTKALAYTAFVAVWVFTEYRYLVSDFSWPWLLLGNGFSHEVWAVQWYEYTGILGGSVWVLVCNLLIFEAWQHRHEVRRHVMAAAALLLPLCCSLWLWHANRPTEAQTVKVALIQPNVNCYDKFHHDTEEQERNILALLQQVPADARFILLPETAVPSYYWEPRLTEAAMDTEIGEFWQQLRDSLRAGHPDALLITGANTRVMYAPGTQTRTARPMRNAATRQPYAYYDHFNTAVGLDTTERLQLHHKGRLVIGVENTPTIIFDILDFLVIDLGGIVGQIGVGQHGSAFDHDGVKVGPAICYEGLYGEFYGEFVRRGAEFMAILSNDGWWGDTPGYRHLFTISRLRAIEHRRAVARAANTGRSGFISPRGDIGETLDWEERGVLTAEVLLNRRITFYTRHGDYVGRLAQFVTLLSLLYYFAWRIRRRNHLN